LSSRAPNGILQATLILAFFRAIWHLPLVISGSIPWYDFVFFSLAFQIMITWIYNRTRGSVLIVMLLHLTSNIVARIMLPLFSEPDRSRYWMLIVIMGSVVALAILGLSRLRLGMPENTSNLL
jgi:hypothetical protein